MTPEQFEWMRAQIAQLREDIQQIRERQREVHAVVCDTPEVKKSRRKRAVEEEKLRILTKK